MPVADLEALEEHDWKVAGRHAFPTVSCKEPGLSMRPPLAWEVELMEGCLRAVPDFVKRRKQDDSTPEEMTVPGVSGPLKLTLSWVGEASGGNEVKKQTSNNAYLVDAACERAGDILMFCKKFKKKKPVMLLELPSQRSCAYPYQEFKNTLSERSQRMLEQEYEEALQTKQFVVFVRDGVGKR